MKKLYILLLCMLALVSCGKKDNVSEHTKDTQENIITEQEHIQTELQKEEARQTLQNQAFQYASQISEEQDISADKPVIQNINNTLAKSAWVLDSDIDTTKQVLMKYGAYIQKYFTEQNTTQKNTIFQFLKKNFNLSGIHLTEEKLQALQDYVSPEFQKKLAEFWKKIAPDGTLMSEEMVQGYTAFRDSIGMEENLESYQRYSEQIHNDTMMFEGKCEQITDEIDKNLCLSNKK